MKDFADRLLITRSWLAHAALGCLYLLLSLPQITAIKDYSALVFPLEARYITTLLFGAGGVRSDLAETVITGSNAAFIYPPGIYLAMLALPSIAFVIYASFALQLAVGPLLYRMLRLHCAPSLALPVAGLGVFFCTRATWIAPDFVIQPITMAALLMLLPSAPAIRRGVVKLAAIGILAGLVTVFKHNVGIFFAILCGVLLFLDSCHASGAVSPPRGRIIALVLLAGFFVFAVIFSLRVIHLDEIVYYVLPYLAFWLLFVAFARRAAFSFDAVAFAQRAVVFGLAALVLPAAVFLAVGSVVGYGNYWHALFGMGFKYLQVWDHGIVGVMRATAGAITYPVYGTVVALLFLVPLAVNGFAVICLGLKRAEDPARQLERFRIASLGIMAVFMLFPLEGYHILATKLFVFVFAGLFFLNCHAPRAMPAARVLLTIAAIPIVVYGLTRPFAALRVETAPGTPEMQRVIGMPLQKDIARELSNQLDVLRRATGGGSYYVVDSSGGVLIGLAAFIDPVLPQYYIEMRDGILDRAATDAIKADIAKRAFVVVNAGDYTRRDAPATDPYLREILALIDQHYTPIDAYRLPDSLPASIKQLAGFTVFKARAPIAAAQ